MSRTRIALIIIFSLLIIVSVPLVIRFVIPKIFPAIEEAQNQIKPQNLPVNPNNKAVQNIKTIYTFKGRITDVIGVGSNTEIKTDIKAPNLPNFVITPATVLSLNLNGQIVPISKGRLTKGKVVLVTAEYNNKKKSWITTRVTVAEKQPQPFPEEIGLEYKVSSKSAEPEK